MFQLGPPVIQGINDFLRFFDLSSGRQKRGPVACDGRIFESGTAGREGWPCFMPP